jgi:hypothetical protein
VEVARTVAGGPGAAGGRLGARGSSGHPLRTRDVGHDQELKLVEVVGTRNEEHEGIIRPRPNDYILDR